MRIENRIGVKIVSIVTEGGREGGTELKGKSFLLSL